MNSSPRPERAAMREVTQEQQQEAASALEKLKI